MRKRGPNPAAWIVTGLAAVAAGTVVGLATVALTGGSATPGRASDGPVASSAASRDVTRSAPASPPPAAPGVPFGQAAAPLQLEVAAIGVDAEVLPYTADDARSGYDGLTGEACYRDGVIVCVDPPSATEVYWQRGGLDGVVNGDMPGTESRGTVYFYGHSGGAGAGAVFDALPSLPVGETALVTTVNGALVYRVDEVFTVPKDRFTSEARVTDQVPGRLLLVSCDHSEGAGLAGPYAVDNVVAVLQVVAAGPVAG